VNIQQVIDLLYGILVKIEEMPLQGDSGYSAMEEACRIVRKSMIDLQIKLNKEKMKGIEYGNSKV